jgi:hypothetical protein
VRKYCAVALTAALLWAPVVAQVVVEEGVSTDTVDLFSKSVAPQKSGILAMCASVALPGLGHQYLGDNTKALAYYSTEALFIFGAILCDHYSRRTFENAKAFAWFHAGATGEGADDQFWQNVGRYSDSKGYNDEMDRIYRNGDEVEGEPGKLVIGPSRIDNEKSYLTPELQWRWDDIPGDPVNRKEYGRIMDQSMTFRVVSSFFIGAMVLNRLVSFIDARVTAKQMETKSLSSINFVPRYDFQTRAAGLALNCCF